MNTVDSTVGMGSVYREAGRENARESPLKIAGFLPTLLIGRDRPSGRNEIVRMLDQLFGNNPANMERALSRASLRHELLSKNLANVNTPGYKRQDVDFAMVLDQEVDRRTAIRTDRGSIRTDGNSVDLEQEVVAMAETELRYQMLTEVTSRYFSGLKNVIREGR